MDASSWPVTPGIVRHPRWRALLNGTPLTGCESVDVHETNSYRANTVYARFSSSADPSVLSTWADADPPVLLEIQAALLADGAAESSASWQSAFVGQVDKVHIDLVGGTVEVEGRDLSSRLIDAKTKETFANQTVSEIVQTLAARRSLTVDVDDFGTLAGAFYQLEHDKLTADSFSKTTTEWDLLVYLARHVGADCYLSGQTLHFKIAVDAATATPVPLAWTPATSGVAYPSSPVLDIQLERNLTLAKDIRVVMRIWSSKGKTAQEIAYPTTKAADAQEYVLPPRPGMSPAAALAYVQAQYADLVKHERLCTVTMPGEMTMDARTVVALSGTGTSFDLPYYVDEIDREWSMDAGFRQTLKLKNHRTESDAEVG